MRSEELTALVNTASEMYFYRCLGAVGGGDAAGDCFVVAVLPRMGLVNRPSRREVGRRLPLNRAAQTRAVRLAGARSNEAGSPA
jgi:hypothetical protein